MRDGFAGYRVASIEVPLAPVVVDPAGSADSNGPGHVLVDLAVMGEAASAHERERETLTGWQIS
jgi:hypothetical protein